MNNVVSLPPRTAAQSLAENVAANGRVIAYVLATLDSEGVSDVTAWGSGPVLDMLAREARAFTREWNGESDEAE